MNYRFWGKVLIGREWYAVYIATAALAVTPATAYPAVFPVAPMPAPTDGHEQEQDTGSAQRTISGLGATGIAQPFAWDRSHFDGDAYWS